MFIPCRRLSLTDSYPLPWLSSAPLSRVTHSVSDQVQWGRPILQYTQSARSTNEDQDADSNPCSIPRLKGCPLHFLPRHTKAANTKRQRLRLSHRFTPTMLYQHERQIIRFYDSNQHWLSIEIIFTIWFDSNSLGLPSRDQAVVATARTL